MRTKVSEHSLEQIRADCGGRVKYSLLCLRVGQTSVYAVYAEGGGYGALEVLGRDPVAARDAYGRILGGELSPVHLFEWVSDWREQCEKTPF